MRWRDLPLNPAPGVLRRFGLFGWLILTAAAGWQVTRERWLIASVMLLLAGALAILAVVRPTGLRLVYVGLMVATFPLSWLVSHLILMLIFFVVFAPVGLFFRLIGRDPLQRFRPASVDTYWKDKPQAENLRSYFRQS